MTGQENEGGKFQQEMEEKSPTQAIEDDLGRGGAEEGPAARPSTEDALTSGDPEDAADIPNPGI